MKIINAHTHAVKPRVRGMADGSIESLLKDMELGGISKSLVFSSMLSSKDYSMAELMSIASKDSRLSIVYTINVDKPIAEQAAEIDGHMGRDEVCAVKIMLGYQGVMPCSEKLQPIYDVCERHGLPAIFHTGDTLWSHAKVRYSHPLNIDELAVDRRKLTIVMAHIGNPWTVDAAEVIYKNRNVYGDISGLFLGFNDKRYNADEAEGERLHILCRREEAILRH